MKKLNVDIETLTTEEFSLLIQNVHELHVNPFDAYIGFMIKKRRKVLNLSQQHVAYMLGITFQQVQKYEKGINRISAERLWDVAQLFHIPYEYFFSGLTSFLSAFENPKLLPSCYAMAKTPLSFEEDDILEIISKMDSFVNKNEPKSTLAIQDVISNINEQTDTSYLVSYFKNLSIKDFNDYYSFIVKKLSKNEQEKYAQALRFKPRETAEISKSSIFKNLLKKQAKILATTDDYSDDIFQN